MLLLSVHGLRPAWGLLGLSALALAELNTSQPGRRPHWWPASNLAVALQAALRAYCWRSLL